LEILSFLWEKWFTFQNENFGMWQPSTSTPPPSERTAAVDLDPASLGARHHRALPQALDTAFGEGATPPLPH
jgi:hypothetical protein